MTLMTAEALQREHSLREVFNGLRWIVRSASAWWLLPHDLPRWAAVYPEFQTMYHCRTSLTGALKLPLRFAGVAMMEAGIIAARHTPPL
ncbi:transposase [Phormidium tenue FACHB-886]|nr:transposase [Phormidium tenue FACHB-886]